MAFTTAAYLAVLLAIRIRHKLAEIRREKPTPIIDVYPYDATASAKRQTGIRWHPPAVPLQVRLVLIAIAAAGAILLMAAVWLPPR
ncbi:hypothetical protein QFZ34_001445 [Phyllobacterium ifriqiyense]|uniref:Uncharacterized protein n=1 Tax=Phyllobacterium ifriqiyense TaxID=314238 RepID=A0ABU0S682_9HYPH|nr:hypothetical protein [Phyllobacterium ifriqiyense]MDQ0996268.1 hypothetical protein [Phyllobacterium ifriqiyense]